MERRPHGVKSNELRTLTGVKQVLRVLNPMRAAGEIKCWPVKGRGSVWFLAKYEDNIEREWTRKQAARKQAEAAAALARYHAKRAIPKQAPIEKTDPPCSVSEV